MRMQIIILIFIILAGCAGPNGIFEAYNEKPINIQCAYEAIKNIKGMIRVSNKEHEIIFHHHKYEGNLYHGGEQEFVSYGMSISPYGLFSKRPEIISSSVIDAIKSVCTSKNT